MGCSEIRAKEVTQDWTRPLANPVHVDRRVTKECLVSPTFLLRTVPNYEFHVLTYHPLNAQDFLVWMVNPEVTVFLDW